MIILKYFGPPCINSAACPFKVVCERLVWS